MNARGDARRVWGTRAEQITWHCGERSTRVLMGWVSGRGVLAVNCAAHTPPDPNRARMFARRSLPPSLTSGPFPLRNHTRGGCLQGGWCAPDRADARGARTVHPSPPRRTPAPRSLPATPRPPRASHRLHAAAHLRGWPGRAGRGGCAGPRAAGGAPLPLQPPTLPPLLSPRLCAQAGAHPALLHARRRGSSSRRMGASGGGGVRGRAPPRGSPTDARPLQMSIRPPSCPPP